MYLCERIKNFVNPFVVAIIFFESLFLFIYIYLSYSFVYYLENNKNQCNTHWKNVLAPKKSGFFSLWLHNDDTVFNSTIFPLCVLPVSLTLLCCTVLLFLHLSQAIGMGSQKWFYVLWNFHMIALVLFLYIILPILFIQFVIQTNSFNSYFFNFIHWIVMILLTLFISIAVPFVGGKKIFFLDYSDISADSLLLRCSLYGVILAAAFGGVGITQIVYTYFSPYQISQEYTKTLKLYYSNIDTRLDKIKNDIYSYSDIQRTLTSVSHTDKLKEKKKFWGILCLGVNKSKEDVFLENEVKLLEQAKQEIQEEIDECLALEKAKKQNSFFPLLFQRFFRFLVVIFCIYQCFIALHCLIPSTPSTLFSIKIKRFQHTFCGLYAMVPF
ncbi:uncharacterized protein LOC128883632 isoform X2 [Hylaeus volcanicus]|uniref:uncharacterized protein LOC128883632 isoform X2 n=1 Tax=Hylaeus volcanicus TaxID=313075 RepID=UPI0023B8559E|nr:uncharacterized protein LOC128883632 isoform X2 [Hylaeus volcanicus]